MNGVTPRFPGDPAAERVAHLRFNVRKVPISFSHPFYSADGCGGVPGSSLSFSLRQSQTGNRFPPLPDQPKTEAI